MAIEHALLVTSWLFKFTYTEKGDVSVATVGTLLYRSDDLTAAIALSYETLHVSFRSFPFSPNTKALAIGCAFAIWQHKSIEHNNVTNENFMALN